MSLFYFSFPPNFKRNNPPGQPVVPAPNGDMDIAQVIFTSLARQAGAEIPKRIPKLIRGTSLQTSKASLLASRIGFETRVTTHFVGWDGEFDFSPARWLVHVGHKCPQLQKSLCLSASHHRCENHTNETRRERERHGDASLSKEKTVTTTVFHVSPWMSGFQSRVVMTPITPELLGFASSPRRLPSCHHDTNKYPFAEDLNVALDDPHPHPHQHQNQNKSTMMLSRVGSTLTRRMAMTSGHARLACRSITSHSQLPEEHKMIYEMCRKFADEELAPNAGEWDQKHEYPKDAVAQLSELGLMGINVPEDVGGVGLDALSYAIAMEEISRGCASVGVIMSAHNSLYLSPVQNFGTPEQHEKWVVSPFLWFLFHGCPSSQ